MTRSPAQHARDRLGGAAKRHRGNPDHPEVTGARRDLEVTKLAEHIRKVARSAPLPTPEQFTMLRSLLPAPDGGDGNG